MIRNISYIFLIVIATNLFLACNDNVTYAEELKVEQKLINDFIKRHDIQVVTQMPTEFPWPDNVYFKARSGLYFRLVKEGDNSIIGDSIQSREQIITKYMQYTLGLRADTISTQSTVDLPHPHSFDYQNFSEACMAWHEAVSYMKYSNAEAKLIVPSQIGFPQFIKPATPVGYDLTIRVLR